MRISTQVEDEVQSFDDAVTLSSGVEFDYRKTLKHINRNKRGKFESCSDENAVFWPLGMQRAPHFAKKLNPDVKNFNVEGYGDINFYQAWVCDMRFRKWAKDTGFTRDLDDYAESLADFGSCAIKLVEKKGGGFDTNEVDLMKLWFDPTIKSFYDQTKIELHELQQHTVDNMEGWSNKRLAWNKAETVDDEETEKADATETVAEKRKFWERVGWFDIGGYENGDLTKSYDPGYVKGDDGVVLTGEDNKPLLDTKGIEADWKFMHVIFSASGDDEVVVFSEEISVDKDIYIDLHISKYEDRWLRIGVYERLFDLQRMTNEAVNYNRETQQIASLLMFKTKNKKIVGSNILAEAKSGLITDADLEQIGIDDRNFGEFLNSLSAYENKANTLSLTPDVITGIDPEAKTFRGQAALTNAASSVFKGARDRVLSRISEMLIDRILPHEVKDWNKEKSIEIAGFDADVRMFDIVAPLFKLNEWLSNEFKKGRNPTPEQQAVFMEDLRNDFEREGRKFKLPADFFDFNFGLSINASSETENKNEMNEIYYNVVSWVLANPAVTTIPAFREYVEKNGISPFHINQEQQQELQQGATGQPTPQPKQEDKLMSKIDSE